MSFSPIMPMVLIIILAILLLGFTVFCFIKKGFRKVRVFRRIAIGALILLAFMRPSIGTTEAERDLSDYNIFLVVDNTGSMVVKDMQQKSKFRYEVMKEDMKKAVELFVGAKYSITIIDFAVYQAMPLLNDSNSATSFIDSIKPRTSTTTINTDISSLIEYTNGRVKKYNERYPTRKSLVFMFSDGEDIKAESVVPDGFSSQIAGGAVIGYGSTEGGRVNLVRDGEVLNDSFAKESGNSDHISKLNEKNLQSIASKLGVSYYRRASASNIFDNASSFIHTPAEYTRDEKSMTIRNDMYWLFILVAVGLLLWDFSSILKTLSLERKAAK